LISEKEITNSEKIEAVRNWPVPRSKKQVHSFLGFCSYYRKFVKRFSLMAKPLFSLIENQRKFIWDKSCQEIFEELKRNLISLSILSNGEWEIYSRHAANYGIGAVFFSSSEGKRENFGLL